MKKLVLSSVLLFITTAIFAQNGVSKSYFGLKAGVNVSTNNYDPDVNGFDISSKTGFAGGIYYNIGLGRLFSIQPELLYSSMGSKFATKTIPNTSGSLNLNYLSVPVLFKLTPVWRLGIFAGPQMDFLMGAKTKIDGQSDEDIKDQIKGTDFGGTVGAEFWLTRNIGVYGRYMTGFNSINEDNYGIPNTDVKNNAWQFGLTVGFRHKTKAPVVVAPVVPVVVDTDGDGIPDGEDKCPAVAGTAKYQGCPVPDTDGDGINDENDKCPTVAGTAKYQGCPVPDTDGDGINDENDKCPTVAGTAKYEGCPIPDTDGDGINDESDRCPKVAGIAGNLGCPEMILYYKRDVATLSAEDKANLDKVATFLTNNPDINITLEGHTSTLGDTKYNQTLSEKRANNSVAYLVSKGIDKSRLTAIGYGEQYPIGDNSKEEGRAQSRRTVVKVTQ
ncbi:MAG TPA: OmpA family protein [Chitinophagaceae bacterium]|nr:OmpA family protein [Chitinophagaceae bacterium]